MRRGMFSADTLKESAPRMPPFPWQSVPITSKAADRILDHPNEGDDHREIYLEPDTSVKYQVLP